MSEHITVTATVAAWLSEYHQPADLMDALERGDAVRAVSLTQFYGAPDMASFSGYIRVGEADITVRLMPRDEQTRIAIEALNAQADQLRAAYLTAQQAVTERISRLRALPMGEPA